ncbi:MAG: Exodeoxyribonuclease 7 small subunit [Myxococcota bacterium]|nr:Exodeoxyribonuclease 7 small subunit [Myxococcota bacterium]
MEKKDKKTRESGQSPTFEESMSELEDLVRSLEAGGVPLDQALQLFERGVRLSRELEKRLAEAEARVEILLANGDKAPFDEKAPGPGEGGG